MRRFRDAPLRGATAAADVPATAAVLPGQGLALAALERRGHRWLRFPDPWEARFREDSAPGRQRLLVLCAVVGLVSVWFGSANDVQAFATLSPTLVGAVRWGLLAAVALALVVMTAIPARCGHGRWHEAMTTFDTVMIILVTFGLTMAGEGAAAYNQDTVAGAVVMYAAIAARQRFRWILFTVVLTVGLHALLIRGDTPVERAIAAADLRFLVLTGALTLLASYDFEWGDRRAWVLERLADADRAALVSTRRSLEDAAGRDGLTGLRNRRWLDAALADAAVAGRPTSLVAVDIDHFKDYNDRHGHLGGDECLRSVAAALAAGAEAAGGQAARIGGEEFAILLPGTTVEPAAAVADRVRRRVLEAEIAHGASPVGPFVTVSLGVATWTGAAGSGTPQDILAVADAALYMAKHDGRDRVVVVRGTVDDGVGAPAVAGRMTGAGLATGSSRADRSCPADADPASTGPGPDPAGTHDPARRELLAVLGRPWWGRLRFPGDLEERYRQDGDGPRRRRLVLAVVLGQVVLVGSVAAGRDMLGALADPMLRLHLWTAPLVAAVVLLAVRLRLRPAAQEWLYGALAAAQLAATAWLLSRGHSVLVMDQVTALVVFPLFVGVAARLPLWPTCLVAVTTAAALTLPSAQDPVAQLVLSNSRTVVALGTVYTLIAVLTLERWRRRTWLVGRLGDLERADLERTTTQLRRMSLTDPLTGLGNRRHFDHRLDQEWEAARGQGRPLTLAILDVDHFKSYNDGYGHTAGDECLTGIGTLLLRVAAEQGALAARIGGEEFAVLTAGLGPDEALGLGERLCAAVRDAELPHGFSPTAGHVTVSVGVASLVPDGRRHPTELLSRGDEALYRAKVQGRDRVVALRGVGGTAPVPA